MFTNSLKLPIKLPIIGLSLLIVGVSTAWGESDKHERSASDDHGVYKHERGESDRDEHKRGKSHSEKHDSDHKNSGKSEHDDVRASGSPKLNFGSQDGSVSHTVTLKVSSATSITFEKVTTEGGDDRFSVDADNCSGKTFSGGSCQVTVKFDGSGDAKHTGFLVVPYTGGVGSPQKLKLSGE